MKKRSLVCLAVALVAALCCALFAACGSYETFNYSDVRVESDQVESDQEFPAEAIQMYENLYKNMYGTMYAGSTLSVSDNDFKFSVGGNEGTITYRVEGDRYVLSGEMADQMSQAISAALDNLHSGLRFEVEMYFLEVQGGWDFVIALTQSVASQTMKLRICMEYRK